MSYSMNGEFREWLVNTHFHTVAKKGFLSTLKIPDFVLHDRHFGIGIGNLVKISKSKVIWLFQNGLDPRAGEHPN